MSSPSSNEKMECKKDSYCPFAQDYTNETAVFVFFMIMFVVVIGALLFMGKAPEA